MYNFFFVRDKERAADGNKNACMQIFYKPN